MAFEYNGLKENTSVNLCAFGWEVVGGQFISRLGSVIELLQFNCMINRPYVFSSFPPLVLR